MINFDISLSKKDGEYSYSVFKSIKIPLTPYAYKIQYRIWKKRRKKDGAY